MPVKSNYAEVFFCLSCKAWIYEESKAVHKESAKHLSLASRLQDSTVTGCRPQEIFKCTVGSTWEEQAEAFSKYLKLDTIALANTKFFSCLKSDLLQALHSVGVVDVKCYGSFALDLASSESDIDISLVTNDGTLMTTASYAVAPNTSAAEVLNIVKSKLMQNSKFTYPLCLPDGRIPVLKIFYESTQIDITINNVLAVNNTDFIKHIMTNNTVKNLVVIIRNWCKTYSASVKLSKYAVVLLLIDFLQKNGLLPRMANFLENANKFELSYVSFNKLPVKIENSNLKEILTDFFSSMQSINFSTCVVSVLENKVIPKVAFNNVSKLIGQEQLKAVKLLQNRKIPLQVTCPMVIQDPFNATSNTSGNIHCVRELEMFLKQCALSHQVCLQEKSTLSDLLFTMPVADCPILNREVSICYTNLVSQELNDTIIALAWLKKVIFHLRFIFKNFLNMEMLTKTTGNETKLTFELGTRTKLWMDRENVPEIVLQDQKNLYYRELHTSRYLLTNKTTGNHRQMSCNLKITGKMTLISTQSLIKATMLFDDPVDPTLIKYLNDHNLLQQLIDFKLRGEVMKYIL